MPSSPVSRRQTGDTSLHIRLEDAKAVTQRSAMRYDREGDNHYDCLSALMKSIRGSDPDAAIHYLARFLEVGDLPACCRRLLCSAAEDIGLAYPQAIPIVKACVDSALQLGMPEARLPLADAVLLLATAPKSNSGVLAIDAALADVRHGKTGVIPARAAERPRRQRRAGARAGLSLPAQFPEPLGPAAVPAGPVKGHGLLSLRRQQGRAGRPALLGRDQRRQRWKFRSVIFIVMKKPHPCGASRWLVLRTGADLRLRCTGCGHEVMKPRFQILPRVRSVERGEKQG